MNNSSSSSISQNQNQVPVQPNSGPGIQLPGMVSAIEHYRLSQLYQYAMAAERLRSAPPGSQSVSATAAAFFPPIPPGLRPELAPFLYSSYCRIDPRLALCRPPDEPKPQHSYIGLIAMAILGSPDKKLVLSDIYQYILDNYPYFRSRGPGWRNSIRHNLSLNDCFVKSGRSANGKGHYWAIHPANIEDFTKGDFRRRKAQRKVRKHMGLAVDDPDSPSPPPMSPPPVNWPDHPHHPLLHPHPGNRHLQPPHLPFNPHVFPIAATNVAPNFEFANSLISRRGPEILVNSSLTLNMNFNQLHRERKRFDVASLLAPEQEILTNTQSGVPASPTSTSKSVKSEDDCDMEHYSSGAPSPVSPICKAFKKLSPEVSEDAGSDYEKEQGKSRHKSSSDEESSNSQRTGTTCNIHRNLIRDALPERNILNLQLQNTPSSNASGIPTKEDKRINSYATQSGCSHHHTSPNSISPVSPAGGQPPHDPILHQHLGLPPGHSPVAGHGFSQSYPPTFLQHNPSLASLMLLSSRYREIASEKYREMANRKSH